MYSLLYRTCFAISDQSIPVLGQGKGFCQSELFFEESRVREQTIGKFMFAKAEGLIIQIIDLHNTEKLWWYFAITKFSNCFIIQSTSFFYIIIRASCSPTIREAICIFQTRGWVQFWKSGILFVPKHIKMASCISRLYCLLVVICRSCNEL